MSIKKSIYLFFCILLLLFSCNPINNLPDIYNTPPIASAGRDEYVHVGDTVYLNGSDSRDPEWEPLSYTWEITDSPDESSSFLIDSDKVISSFIPDLAGEYIIKLNVSDGKYSDTDEISVFVYAIGNNIPPIADAGNGTTYYSTFKIILNGSGSYDPDGVPGPLTIIWEILSKPADSILTNDSINDRFFTRANFSADKRGDYIFQITINDGELADTDTVICHIINLRPIISCDTPIFTLLGNTTELNGSGTYDLENDPLTYTWEFSELPAGSLLSNDDITNRFSSTSSFIPDIEGEYNLNFIVNDGYVDSIKEIINYVSTEDDGFVDIDIY